MRCSSYCTAEEYTLNQETISILEKTTINPEFVEKVLHYQLANEHDSHPIDVFLFTFGCIIIWGADEKKEEEILRNIGFVEKRKLKEAHSEFIDFDYNDIEDRTYINEEKNIIILGNDFLNKSKSASDICPVPGGLCCGTKRLIIASAVCKA